MANDSGKEELTIVSVTAARQALWSSGGNREKFLSHQVFTKCSATHLKICNKQFHIISPQSESDKPVNAFSKSLQDDLRSLRLRLQAAAGRAVLQGTAE